MRNTARYGALRLPPPRPGPAWLRLLLQFHNAPIHVLLAAGVITALLGRWLDSGMVLGGVIVNAVIGFMHEGRADRRIE